MNRANNPAEFYPQGSLNVASYDLRADLDRRLFEDPIPFYLAQARETGGPVLELGCGTGRIAGAIAKAGIAVEGLDLSPAMLSIAKSKYPDLIWHLGDMCQADLGRDFALIIIPFRGLQEIPDARGQRAALENAFRHLRAGGRLVFDLVDPDLRFCTPAGDPDVVELPIFPMPENVGPPAHKLQITAMERTSDPLTQRFDEHWRFEELGPEGNVIRVEDCWHRLRWVHRAEMALMLELAGFTDISEASDFKGNPPRYAANQVWQARKPVR